MLNFWRMQNVVNSAGETEGEILLYDVIASSQSWWYDTVTPKQFDAELKALGDVKTINVRINSDGGDVVAGNSIIAMLQRHPANTVAYIDGMAASMAGVIAASCDTVVMAKNSMLMAHEVISGIMGTADEMIKYAELIKKIQDNIVAVFVAKTGKTSDEINALIKAETYMTAQEALDQGFIDKIEETTKTIASLKGNILNMNGRSFDMSNFKNFSAITNKLDLKAPENVQKSSEKPENKPQDVLNPENALDIVKIKEIAKNEGITQERERIKAIDDLGIIGNQELINKAKFEAFFTAEQTALAVIKAEKQFKSNYLADTASDAAKLANIKPSDSSSSDNTTNMTAFERGFNKNRR